MICVVVAFALIGGGVLIFTGQDVGPVVSLCSMLALFVAPEKLAAFFGPVLKRKDKGRGENQK